MKSVGYSRSYPSVLGSEAIKGCDGIGVTQHDGNLSAFGAEGRLPLRAGLGLGCGHGSELDEAEGGGFFRRDSQAVTGRVARDLKNRRIAGDVSQAVDVREVGADAGQNVLEDGAVAREGGDLLVKVAGRGEGGHIVLHVGPIPTVESSYSVTSDMSTPRETA